MAGLTLVQVPLPNHWGADREAIWAEPVADDLFELHSMPFYAYGLNYGDVVRVTDAGPDLPPRITSVQRRSGHATMRVMFFETVAPADRPALLDGLASLHVTWEAANERYYALDLEPDAATDEVRRRLDEWEAAGMIEYETCQARQPGSFDDVPPERG